MEKVEIDEDLLDEIITDLMGTCRDIDDVLNDYDIEFDDLEDEHFSYIDDTIFCCDQCGWWFEISDSNDYENGMLICNHCLDDEED